MDIDKIPDVYLPPRFERTIVLNDGTELKAGGSTDSSGDCLWIWIDEEMNLITAMSIFSDATKTEKITVNRSLIEKTIYNGYTKLKTINVEISKISICLIKPRN